MERGSGNATTIYFIVLFKTIEWRKDRFFYLLFIKRKEVIANITRWEYVSNFFLFGIYKSLNRADYDQEVAKLVQTDLVQSIHENTYVVTTAGNMQLNKWKDDFAFPTCLHGLHYGEIGETFWKRLSLIVQTISNLQQVNTKFIPIQQDTEIMMWVKRFLTGIPYMRSELAKRLWKEMYTLLQKINH